MKYGFRMVLLQRAVAVPACPSGEQITNGGFETGDLTGWTSEYSYVTDVFAHTGTYSCYLPTEGYVQQTLNLPVNCVESFTLWVLSNIDSPQVDVIVHYTDETEDIHSFFITEAWTWTQFDMLPYLTSGKTIAYIRIHNPSTPAPYVDDVSIVGTG